MKRIWNFIFECKLYICIFVVYLCFCKSLETLYNSYLLPILINFTVSNETTILLVLALIWILVDTFRKWKKNIIVSNREVGCSLLVLFFWVKYRIYGGYAYSSCIPWLCYVDFLALIAVKYLLLKVVHRDSNIQVQSSDGFLEDEPITSCENDLLNRKGHAYSLSDKLLATNTENSAFTLGIVAPWGYGKSSFLCMMKNYMHSQYRNQVIIVSFHPWIYGKSSNLTYLFFEELSKAIAPYSTVFSLNIMRYAGIVSNLENPWLKLTGYLLNTITSKNIEQQYEDLKKQIKKVNHKIVVFIDDVDRLGANEIGELFKLARNTSNLPFMYFVFAYDQQYVVDTLNINFSIHSLKYSQKIMQEEYHLPLIETKGLKERLLYGLQTILNPDELESVKELLDGKSFQYINVFDYLKNFRDVIRLVNDLRENLMNLHEEIDVCDYLILEILKQKYPYVFNILINKNNHFLVLNNRGVLVYFNGENGPERKDDIVSKIYPVRLFNILEYVKSFKQKLYISSENVDELKWLLDILWGENRSERTKGINKPEYVQRYFYSTLLDEDVSDKEFNQLLKSPFENMKAKLNKWTLKGPLSLSKLILKMEIKDKDSAYKQLHMLFYVGSKGNMFITFGQIAQKIIDLKAFDPKFDNYTTKDKEEILECINENGINIFQLSFLSFLYEKSIYDDALILSKNEIVELQRNLFLQYLNEEHSMRDVLECWRKTSHEDRMSCDNGAAYEEIVPTADLQKKMKEYAMNHIEDFVESTISYFTPNPNNKYRISGCVIQIWGSWDAFYKYVMHQELNTQKFIEYKKFLEEMKNVNFDSSVYFVFKYIHFES